MPSGRDPPEWCFALDSAGSCRNARSSGRGLTFDGRTVGAESRKAVIMEYSTRDREELLRADAACLSAPQPQLSSTVDAASLTSILGHRQMHRHCRHTVWRDRLGSGSCRWFVSLRDKSSQSLRPVGPCPSQGLPALDADGSGRGVASASFRSGAVARRRIRRVPSRGSRASET